MKHRTDTESARAVPRTSAVATDLMIAAWQRTLALQADWIDQTLHRGVDHSRLMLQPSVLADPRVLANTLMLGPWQSAPLAEPTWRWLGSLWALNRDTAAAMMALAGAQLRGADDEVDRIARDAHDEVDRATTHAAAATAAAGNAMAYGLASAARLGRVAALDVEDTVRGAGAAARDTVARAAGAVDAATGAAARAASDADEVVSEPGGDDGTDRRPSPRSRAANGTAHAAHAAQRTGAAAAEAPSGRGGRSGGDSARAEPGERRRGRAASTAGTRGRRR